jgi:hypothetical protein
MYHFVHRLHGTLQEDNYLDHVITINETWSYQYDPEAKHQSME